jgi:hypothetical protein
MGCLFRIEHCETVMMLGRDNKILGSSISDEINPILGFPVIRSEVRKEVIIVCSSKGVELMVVHVGLVGVSVVVVPPVPLRIDLPWGGIALKSQLAMAQVMIQIELTQPGTQYGPQSNFDQLHLRITQMM